MKKYFTIYFVLCVIILTGALLFALMPSAGPGQDIDFVAINELAKQSAEHWQEPSELESIIFPYRFVILDINGDARYASGEGLPESLTDALRRGFVPMDITLGSSIIGKALVETSPVGAQTQSGRQRTVVIAAFVSIFVLSAALLWALNKTLLKPVKSLETFAHKITTGQLDEPLPVDRNNIFGLFTQSFDIMRLSLQEARREQHKAERTRKEMIASLSHDVKTPVTSIRLIAELLQAKTTDAASLEKLKSIEQKADQIDRLMNDLLHSTLEELGELKVEADSVASTVLAELFREMDTLDRTRIGAVPACLVELDAVRMRQVIGNILGNSYKYAATDIDVDCGIVDEFLQVAVNDYGPGVTPEELDLITTKFFRGEDARASQKEGEGLGLYIAKLLMEKMGGGLEAFNRDDGFTIRLWVRLSH
ncbi:MAG: HAMP domain-containing histidine kinase [Oscillospiraceae bacterium]|jgi:signal transduction histidine kinase|nr:HAMP domain-containing histidine kinase [Oscillospiraceae bacterium]